MVPQLKAQEATAAFNALDRTGAEWQALVVEGETARIRFELTGKSGLITPERIQGRARRMYERKLRKKYEDLAPGLVDQLVLDYHARSKHFQERRATSQSGKEILKGIAADQGVQALIESVPQLAELAPYLTCISTEPVVLSHTWWKAWGAEAETIPPAHVVEKLKESMGALHDEASAWQRMSDLLETMSLPASPVPTKWTWCFFLGRCVCGSNAYYAWAHGRLRRLWAMHLASKEGKTGRVVFQISTEEPRVLPPECVQFHLIANKVKDEVALWRLRDDGMQTLENGEERRMLFTLFAGDGSPNMITRWDLIFALLDFDREQSVRANNSSLSSRTIPPQQMHTRFTCREWPRLFCARGEGYPRESD